jgi:hypothetical protein
MNRLKAPKLGDIVTWPDTYSGHGYLEGTVVTVNEFNVMVATERGNGMIGYNHVPYERIVRVDTPKKVKP